MAEFLHYFPQAFSCVNLVTLVLGVIVGLVLGATPGLSPTMAVALLVPFTFHMDATAGLILLGSVYTASVAGGAISAILIKIPGAPANIATLLDGYPMAQQGKAQSALNICFISSLIGGLFGMLVMILFTPPLAAVALEFGPSHMFWVAVFGITVMAGLASGSMAKGLIGGAFGLLISTIGYSPILGVPRFIFHDVLVGGVAIVPALIGLFAIPQVFSMAEKLNQGSIEHLAYKPERGVLLKTIVENLKMVKALSIGSVVGAIIGVIPGAGGQVAGLIAYDQTRKFSKNPESFGTGNPQGVAAAEAANNAMVGPSLIPLLTLSIPGSPTAAVLLGGLLIHGLFPGPDLFLNYPNVTYTFIGSMVLAQVGMCIFGILLSRYSYVVMRVSHLYMIAAVSVLAVYGTYSVQNSFDDVIVMFCLGTLMYVGSKFGFSAAPVVLGIILGPIAEDNFLKGKLIADTDVGMFTYFFVDRINIIVIVLCLVSIAYSIYSEVRMHRRQKSGRPAEDSGGAPNLVKKWDASAALVVLAASAGLYASLSLIKNPRAIIFPRIIILVVGALAVLLLVQTLLLRLSTAGKHPAPVKEKAAFPWGPVLLVLIAMLLYLAMLQNVGFYLSTFLFFTGLVFALAGKPVCLPKGIKMTGSAFAFTAVLFILFNTLLKVQMPRGIFL
ncbi:MAG: tripartite tricarboxylate transporter permease [Desulfobacterales bacterium]|nr:tripartite tricarboxylate transporter permease [Desulfobacterales bacterium]